MKEEFSGWGGVSKLAKKLGYNWSDVCDILWKTKHHKQPKFKEILIFSVIRKNLIRIQSGKHLRDVRGNLVKRKEGEQEELLELIKLYEKPTDIVDRTVEEVVAPAAIMEKIFKKEQPKAKDSIIFKTEPYRRNTSRLVYWCNPFEPINKGKLGSTQNWRINKLESSYY